MPGVRRLLAETKSQGITDRILTEENGCVQRAGRGLVPRVDAPASRNERGALRVISVWHRRRTSQCTRPPTRALSSSIMSWAAGDWRRSAAPVLKSQTEARGWQRRAASHHPARLFFELGPRCGLSIAGRGGRRRLRVRCVRGASAVSPSRTRTTACTRPRTRRLSSSATARARRVMPGVRHLRCR